MTLPQVLRWILEVLLLAAKVGLVLYACLRAYRIRLHAVHVYGYIIHEFDPWFNFRAAKYLAKHGWYEFFHWYDYMSWYPLGRPIGTTIYPGMQISAVAIWHAMKQIPKFKWRVPAEVWTYLPMDAKLFFPGFGLLSFGPMSLNNICVMMPAWFGAGTTFFMFLLTAECSGSTSAGVISAYVMAVIPAGLMRTMAGVYDNECVAITTFVACFWLWCRSLRTPSSWPFGILCGLAYIYSVANWGGYIFVNNLIGLNAAVLVAIGKYTHGLYLSYTLWYVIGTAGATFVPVVGWTPLRSLEQIAPLLVFLTLQVIAALDFVRRRDKRLEDPWRFFFTRVAVFVGLALVLLVVSFFLSQVGYFAPWTARIRGLFLKHEKTGNPLVDSVAEHQPGTMQRFEAFLHHARYSAFLGLFLCWHQRTPAKIFPVLYTAVAFHFALKMSRLMIICGPIVAMLSGYSGGIVIDWTLEQFLCLVARRQEVHVSLPERTGGVGSIYRTFWGYTGGAIFPRELRDAWAAKNELSQSRAWPLDRLARIAIGCVLVYFGYQYSFPYVQEFKVSSDQFAPRMANPSIQFQGKNGVIIDDYHVGYSWLRNNTPEDARVMAWWDYGYHITGIGERTSIADGNTWNHEHIATLGRTLTNPEKRAWNIMRHITDYVLVWAGGQKDDMGKSPHLARIGNSVFPDMCGSDDPLCSKFGFKNGQPTKMMAESFLYKAVKHKTVDGVSLSPKLFKEVYTSKRGLLRIFQVVNVSMESKNWIADPKNRVCDAPGSWYCVGQYPPALQSLISKRKNFAQLEDFNRKGGEKSAYTRHIEAQQAAGTGGAKAKNTQAKSPTGSNQKAQRKPEL